MNITKDTLSDSNFQYFLDFIQKSSGLVLETNQLYLIQNRLAPVLQQYKISSLNDLVDRLKQRDMLLSQLVIESLVTHESSFFRDKKVYDYFAEQCLPPLLSNATVTSPIKIWSAACSSGQEPYSIAMLIKEHASKVGVANEKISCKILATDLSEKILEKAKSMTYTHFEIQRGLPASFLIKHFKKDGVNWKINQELRDLIQFQTYNLIQPARVINEAFHAIFCRNVLIYFNEKDKLNVIQHLNSKLKPGGVMILGSSEFILQSQQTLLNLTPVKDFPGIYQKNS
jgi:chemotaxis protein methyltransferase CheR